MLHQFVFTYGLQADCLEADSLYELLGRNHQLDTYQLYHLPQLELYALVFNVDGHWVRTMEERPDRDDIAAELNLAMADRDYIPSGTLNSGWDELEREIRYWWWSRLLDNLKQPAPCESDSWPQRWADLPLETWLNDRTYSPFRRPARESS